MKQISITLLLFTLFAIELDAQRLINATYLSTVTKAELIGQTGLPFIEYDVELYKIQYLTPDTEGNDHMASGLVAIPIDEDIAFPLGCYQHGTVGDREDVPSRQNDESSLPIIFSALGYVTCAPDYVGLGDSPGIHPYVHADTEASAGLDLLRAVRELDADENFGRFSLNDQLFISGYSQGGHAAMALHREIETNHSNEFSVTGSAPMSGPYSISDKMVEFTLGDQNYFTVAYLASLTLGYKRAYPELLDTLTIEDIFKPQYIADVMAFASEEIDLWELNNRLIDRLSTETGAVRPKDILDTTFFNAIMDNPDHVFNTVLRDNDTFDWAPQAPTNLYYCVGDEQVTFENAILAEEVMSQNGSTSVTITRGDTDAQLLSHGGCVTPASTSLIFFFGSLRELTTSNGNLLADNLDLFYYHNFIHVEMPEDLQSAHQLAVYNINGDLLLERSVSSGETLIDVSAFETGLYAMMLRNEKGLYKTVTFVKQ